MAFLTYKVKSENLRGLSFWRRCVSLFIIPVILVWPSYIRPRYLTFQSQTKILGFIEITFFSVQYNLLKIFGRFKKYYSLVDSWIGALCWGDSLFVAWRLLLFPSRKMHNPIWTWQEREGKAPKSYNKSHLKAISMLSKIFKFRKRKRLMLDELWSKSMNLNLAVEKKFYTQSFYVSKI